MSAEQLTIDDLAEGERLRDEGMARVTENSDERHIVLIDSCIRSANASGNAWSTNDLRYFFDTYHAHEQIKPQLFGARVRAAAMRKEMVKVGRVPSTLKSTHAHEIAVWRGRR